MRIAVASGKGGTGKTLVATNLAWFLAKAGRAVAYVDADVEEPNGHLFLRPEIDEERRLSVPVPKLGALGCDDCGTCFDACAFGAIARADGRPGVDPLLCHGCGVCHLACPHRLIAEEDRPIGTVSLGRSGPLAFYSALLDMGEPRAAPLIRSLLSLVANQHRGKAIHEIVDVSPGTSCSAMAAARDADQVLLVTEPTPFGLHDLELALEMCQAMEKPIMVVINRADLGDRRVQKYLKERDIPLLAEIPFSTDVAQAYARRELAGTRVPALGRVLESMVERLALP